MKMGAEQNNALGDTLILCGYYKFIIIKLS